MLSDLEISQRSSKALMVECGAVAYGVLFSPLYKSKTEADVVQHITHNEQGQDICQSANHLID
jgi:hypothetical protein